MSPVRHISEILDEWSAGLAPTATTTAGTATLDLAHLRRHCRLDALWRVGSVGEQLSFGFVAGTAT